MGHIIVKETVNKKIEVLPCIKCGGNNIEINDCGYSSFNIAWGECKNKQCGHRAEFQCSSISKEAIVEHWNLKNNPDVLLEDYNNQIYDLQQKIQKIQDIINPPPKTTPALFSTSPDGLIMYSSKRKTRYGKPMVTKTEFISKKKNLCTVGKKYGFKDQAEANQYILKMTAGKGYKNKNT